MNGMNKTYTANKKLSYIHKNVKVRLTKHYTLKAYWRLLVKLTHS